MEAALNRPRVLQASRFENRSGPQQVVNLAEVLWCHGVNKRNMLRGFLEPRVLVVLTRVLTQLPTQLPQPVEDARSHGRLQSRPVADELVDD